eukprot:g4311.t1
MSRANGKSVELHIVQEPETMWYKDVGGKRKHLTCIVELSGTASLPKNAEFKLEASLHYGSGKKLADEWQWILHFLDLQADGSLPRLRHGKKYRAEVHFRIEKVSTSFMNQRFSVKFRAVPVGNKFKKKLDDTALVVSTNAIESKAKPKRTSAGTRRRVVKRSTSTRTQSSDEAVVSKRRRRGSVDGCSDDVAAKRLLRAIERVEATQKKLEQTESRLALIVSTLNERMDAMEEDRFAGTAFGSISRPASRLGRTDFPKMKRLPSWERPLLSSDEVSSLTSDEATPETTSMKIGLRGYGGGSSNLSPPNMRLTFPRFSSIDFATAFTEREEGTNSRSKLTR